jgi:hypothetical protein
MHEELRAALEVVLPDLISTTGLNPQVREDNWSDVRGQECAHLNSDDGSTVGIWVMSGDTIAAQAAELADQIQEWAIEELFRLGRSPTWPECPEHPGSHPLSPKVAESNAVWGCPATLRTHAVIGHLGGEATGDFG